MNILVIKLSAIGDVIHTLPALNAIRDAYPDAHITWLVEEAAADLVVGHRALDRVLVSRRKKWINDFKSGHRIKALGQAVQFVKTLRDTRYDIIIDFHALLKSGLLVFLAKGKRKIGFGKGMQHMEHSYLFLNEKIPAVSMEIHALDRQFVLAEAAGARSGSVQYHIPVADDDKARVDALLKKVKINVDRPIVAVNPVALWETKLWFNDRFAKISDLLIREHGFQVVFTGAAADQSVIEAILGMMEEKAVSLAGRTTLKMLAALYEKAGFVISTDTGPMHLAAAMDTPVIAVFGPTAPWRTGPYGKQHQVVQADLDCSPCFKRVCKTCECMDRVTVDKVMDAVDVICGDRTGLTCFSKKAHNI